jgi:hypothetical protein
MDALWFEFTCDRFGEDPLGVPLTISSSGRATLQRRYGTWLINRDPPGRSKSNLDPSANIGKRGQRAARQDAKSGPKCTVDDEISRDY